MRLEKTKVCVPMKKFVAPSNEEIACCAFAIVARENPQLADEKWREAEAHLIAVRKHEAGLLRRTNPPRLSRLSSIRPA